MKNIPIHMKTIHEEASVMQALNDHFIPYTIKNPKYMIGVHSIIEVPRDSNMQRALRIANDVLHPIRTNS